MSDYIRVLLCPASELHSVMLRDSGLRECGAFHSEKLSFWGSGSTSVVWGQCLGDRDNASVLCMQHLAQLLQAVGASCLSVFGAREMVAEGQWVLVSAQDNGWQMTRST